MMVSRFEPRCLISFRYFLLPSGWILWLFLLLLEDSVSISYYCFVVSSLFGSLASRADRQVAWAGNGLVPYVLSLDGSY